MTNDTIYVNVNVSGLNGRRLALGFFDDSLVGSTTTPRAGRITRTTAPTAPKIARRPVGRPRKNAAPVEGQ